MKMTKKEVLKAWKEEICGNDNVDPDDELDWRSLFIGFAIGKGLPVSKATESSLREAAFKLESFSK
jgi:hypothetical protein